MATNFSPCKGSYVLNQFPSNVMFGMNGFHVSASGAIQGHHGPLVLNIFSSQTAGPIWTKLGRNVPKEVLFKICPQNLIPSKTLVAMATKWNFISNSLKIFGGTSGQFLK